MTKPATSLPAFPIAEERISDEDRAVVERISTEACRLTGNQLSGDSKQHMVVARLRKRMQEVGARSLAEYERYFLDNRASESDALISLLTTHHTYFFREFSHFEHMLQRLPAIIDNAKRQGEKELRIWSAASSRGQEAYSLAMFLSYHMPKIAPGMSFRIIGTDIDQKSVDHASNGVYSYEEIKSAPLNYLGSHWSRGTGDISAFVKAKKSLKDHVSFKKYNLLEPVGKPSDKPFHVIFCRNVFIYFNAGQIKSAVQSLLPYLTDDGIFYIGISENLYNLGLPLESVGASSFMKTGGTAKTKPAANATAPAPSPAAAAKAPEALPSPLKVVCVDDSASILALMKQILKAKDGFEIVGTAKNGIEAERVIKEKKPHLVTLDIHMPEMDGIQYLEKHFSRNHPPVVMVTSVSRDNEDLALKSLKLGACDYVEKPAMSDLADRAGEIQGKLRSAWRASRASDQSTVSTIDQQFAKKSQVKDPARKAVIITASAADAPRAAPLMKQLVAGNMPGVALLIDGPPAAGKHAAEACAKAAGLPLPWSENPTAGCTPGKATVSPFTGAIDSIIGKHGAANVAVLALGELSPQSVRKLTEFPGIHLLAEDLGILRPAGGVHELTKHVMPATSFAYTALQWLEEKT